MFNVYILYSDKFEEIYIGQTSDIIQRIQYHNFEATNSYTSKYRPWVIVYTEIVTSRQEAMRREKQLKTAKGRGFAWEQVRVYPERKEP